MSDLLTLPCDRLLLDACCAITLYYSEHMADIISAAADEIAVTSYVLEHELISVDITPLVQSGHLNVLAPKNEVERVTIVNFAARLEDGEAYTGAIAETRGWSIATDETKAVTFFAERVPPLRVVTTPELLRHWAETRSITDSQLRSVLQRISTKGRYYPRRSHPLRGWWDIHS